MTRRREGPGSPLLVGMRPLNEDNRFKVLLAFIPDRIGVERRRLLPDGIKAIDGAAGAEERPNKLNEQSVTRTSLRT
jgi:hypothetical protein